ncbi:MAG: shikimate dehydrogenase [Clostridiales bacterium]|nr:shikimate dehydrogenase [Clostridiales bacterium]
MKCALVGKSIGYSYSKDIHEKLGFYGYDLCSVAPEDLDAFAAAHLRGTVPCGGTADEPYLGINVTIPYKKTIMPLLDEVDELAAAIGAVNTVYRRDGKLTGTNTDLYGFLYMLREAGISLRGKKVLILGTGGACAMVRYACLQEGAASVTLATRDRTKAAEPCAVSAYCTYDALPQDTQILINTTPVGTYPDVDSCPVDLSDPSVLPQLEGVADLIYNPAKTTLLMDAQERGIPCTGGLPMLIAQAVQAAERFLEGAPADAKVQPLTGKDTIIRTLTQETARSKRNIVLIGMPGSGKSSLGRDIAKACGLAFRDSDRVIAETTGRKPSAIIREDGETAFRKIESAVLADLAKEHGQVIATGGGVVEREENMRALARNGLFIYLKRKLDNLATKDRPLSKDRAALEALSLRRGPVYAKWADITIDNDRYYKDTLAYLIRRLGKE